MIRNLTRLAAFLLAFSHAIILLLVAFVFPAPDDDNHVLAFSLGVLYSQLALLAVWFAFSSIPLVFRLLVSATGLAMIGGVFCAYVDRTGGPGEVCMVWIAVCLVQWSLTQFPLWLTKSSGWTLAQANVNVALSQNTSQFHIRHLFAWTTAIALLCGIGNATKDWLGEAGNDLQSWVAFFGLLTTTNVLIVGPVIWATLIRRGRTLWVVVALLSVLMLTPLEASLFGKLIISRRLLYNGVLFLVVLNVIYLTALVTALLIARGFGWRLVNADQR